MTFWNIKTLAGGSDLSHFCTANNLIHYADNVRVASGGATANNPNGDVYEFDTDTDTGALIYDASTFTSSPEVHRNTSGIAVLNDELYGLFTYYNSTGPNHDIKVKKWNGVSWSTVLTISSAGTGGLFHGFIGATDSRLYVVVVSGVGAPSPEAAVIRYSDNGSSWSAGSVSGDPLYQSAGVGGNDYTRAGYFPSGVYANLIKDDGGGGSDGAQIYQFSGTAMSIAAANDGTQYYRSTGDDGEHWANRGDPPQRFNGGFSTLATPSNNSDVDEQILSVNMRHSFAAKRVGSSDGTQLWRFNGSTWQLWDLVEYGPGGPNFDGELTALLWLNDDYWILGYDNYVSAYRLFSTPHPRYNYGDMLESQGGIPGAL